MIEMFRLSFDYLGMAFTGKVLAEAYDRGEIKEKPDELQKAYDLGASL